MSVDASNAGGTAAKYGEKSISEPDVSNDEQRGAGLSTTLAHLIGFCGANVVVGTIDIWSLHAARQPRILLLPTLTAILLVCVGGLLMLVASRSLALRFRQPTSPW
jgi:hypothetical protein